MTEPIYDGPAPGTRKSGFAEEQRKRINRTVDSFVRSLRAEDAAEEEEETLIRLGDRADTVNYRGERWCVFNGEATRGRRFLIFVPEAEASADEVVYLTDPDAVDLSSQTSAEDESGVNLADLR